jgi:hypothetical protein
MAMRSSDSPRRVYLRAGAPLICYGGKYFGPSAKATSAINVDREVKLEALPAAGGKARLSVKQSGKHPVSETWVEKHIVFGTRKVHAADAHA